eukprot:2766372-Amphidinium_carterae.1
MSNGIATFAKRVSHLAEASPDLLFIKSDIVNAFGTVHRAAVQDALSACIPSLSQCSRSWISREATGFIQPPHCERRRIVSVRGLQQGDPLSAMAFALVIELAFRHLEQTLKHQGHEMDYSTTILAYIDDTVLGGPQQTAEVFMNAWQASLLKMGMQLNVDKTVLYQQKLQEPGAPTLIPLWRAQPVVHATTE